MYILAVYMVFNKLIVAAHKESNMGKGKAEHHTDRFFIILLFTI